MRFCTDADFSDNMILQRDAVNRIYGFAEPFAEISLRLVGRGSEIAVSCTANENGRFAAELPAVSGGKDSFEAVLSCGDESITLHDILFGDVFHITGQSNMELPVCRTYDPFDEHPEAHPLPDCPYIREFRSPIAPCFDKDTELDSWTEGGWIRADSADAPLMSAAGYYFAREIFDRHDIPIGLINTSAGGAPIEARLPCSELRALGGYDEFLDKATAEGWMERTAKEDLERTQAYYDDLDRRDSLGADIIEGNYPDGESLSLPYGTVGFTGRLWFWNEFEVPEDFPTDSAELILGTLTDSDRCYINGELAGETGYMYPPRYYPLPEGLLKPGINRLAVKLDIYGRYGGFTEGKRWCIKSGSSVIDLTEGWKVCKAVEAEPLVPGTFFPGLILSMYGITTAPAFLRSCRAVLMYQGESNCGNAARYRELFTRWIEFTRERYGFEIPIIWVQLPEFGMNDDSWAVLRQAQLDCTAIPGTAMAVTIGLGESNDLHPVNKWEVGRRLALCAEKLIYGNKDCPPVRCLSAEYAGGEVRLVFSEEVTLTDCGDYFEAVYPDGTVSVPAVQRDGAVVLSCERKPSAVRYAWRSSPDEPRLFDGNGLPVSPFRTDIG